MLGLIANNFVRVYHPYSAGRPSKGELRTEATARARSSNLDIDAAILRDQPLVHRRPLRLRQPAGHADRQRRDRAEVPRPGRHVQRQPLVSGYSKNYNYDDRLRYLEPPHFLDPVQVAWHIQRETLDFP